MSVEKRFPEEEKAESVPSSIQAKFASLDSDDSGELSYRELLPLLKPGVPLAQLEAVMHSLDTDSSGGVDVLEYAGAMMQRPRKRRLRPTTLPGPRPRSLEHVDNAPAPRPRAGDTELPSLAPAILNGSTAERLHGLLGRVNGRARRPSIPLPPGGLTAKERTAAHRGFCFNYRMSDSIPLNRKQLDVRSQACRTKHDTYPPDLPSATIIVVFHNEHVSVLLRTLHSILNQSPPRLLAQLIVVDDASVPTDRFDQEHWEALQSPLAEYCQQLPKTQLVRLAERRGLMLARMEGVWRATGDVVIFLDSHIEATPGWIEPLLARIKEDPRKVVLPRVDTIDAETFEYSSTERSGIGVLGGLA
ncbi:Pgant5, partial [Symbiodinium sp. CCMP2456]